jgi:hypothetical protein
MLAVCLTLFNRGLPNVFLFNVVHALLHVFQVAAFLTGIVVTKLLAKVATAGLLAENTLGLNQLFVSPFSKVIPGSQVRTFQIGVLVVLQVIVILTNIYFE